MFGIDISLCINVTIPRYISNLHCQDDQYQLAEAFARYDVFTVMKVMGRTWAIPGYILNDR